VDVAVSGENCHFRRCGMFLFGCEGNSIVRYCGSEAVTSIPGFVDQLGRSCFRDCGFVNRVDFDLGSRVRLIDSEAFWDCRSLRQICIPSSVEVLGDSCFWACRELRVVTFEGDSKLRELRSHAFASCGSLLAIWIPPSVVVIRAHCFDSCSSLSDVTFAPGSQLTRIDESAFEWCSSRRSICIPASVQVLSPFSFRKCDALSHFTFERGCRVNRDLQWMYTSDLVRGFLVALRPGSDDLEGLLVGLFGLLVFSILLFCFLISTLWRFCVKHF
jgi:hypothetical protein